MGIADGRDLPARIFMDICVIGAGASGLALASNFLNKKLVVGILESGAVSDRPRASEPGEPSQDGFPYAPLETCRLKGFGGSTQALGWGGLCKPLDQQDFKQRPWVADSGWPFDFEHLQPYYDRARVTLGVGEIGALSGRQLIFPGRSSVLSSDNVELCQNYRLGRHLREPVEQSNAVKVLTNVTVLQLEYGDDGQTIRTAYCADAGGNRFRVDAKAFVLAAGGIENARLLLISNQAVQRPQGLVGRYFMDHPRFTIGTLHPADGSIRNTLAQLDRIRVARRQRVLRRLKLERDKHYRVKGLTLPFEVHEKEGLLNYRAWIEPCYIGQDPRALEKLRQTLLDYRDKTILSGNASGMGLVLRNMSWTKGMHIVRPLALARTFRLHHFMEPAPLASSGVTLSSKMDRFGLPLASLSWQLSSQTTDSLRRTIGLFQTELKSSGIGRLEIAPDEWQQLEKPMWTWHHMGTTRMHNDPNKGVVDANCRVHGLKNLFVAGSSVFPTAGNDTPTLTIVALAHRLADHLMTFVI